MIHPIRPKHYNISLEPDLKNFRFSGKTEIHMEALEPVGEIYLNAIDLAIWGCRIKRGKESVLCPFSVDPTKETLRVSLSEEMSGEIDLEIHYMGEINNKMAGFYRSRYLSGGKEKYMAVTQFEESDARRAFPCFDHPVWKATFDVEMIIQDDLRAISNGPVMEEKALGDGRNRIRFQRTPLMSTYLLFFAVGQFEFIEDKEGAVLVRVATTPGMTGYASFGLEFGKKSLAFSESYYDIAYPFPKLDLIAISDFAAGAMENWGAITFRENLLLHYPGITSRAGEERICEVIAHEMAHQWFGNLVSPADWRYLWLNESFATYFGYGIVDHYYPEWDVWDQFMNGTTDLALNRDSLKETFPIEIPGGEHLVINVSTAPIIYSKGGSILRQVEGYVGRETFKEGLRHYLKKHEYACASSHHLWEALESVSSLPVTKMMKSWIEQPGFPIVEVKREGTSLILTQERFTFLPQESDQEWLIPLHIKVFFRNGDYKTIATLLDTGRKTLDLGNGVVSYKVNHGQTGFYRVKYLEEGNLKALGNLVANRNLGPEDRWGLQNDLYALVKRGDISIDDYLDFLSHYAYEDAFLPMISISDNLFHAYLVMEGARKGKVASLGRSLFEQVLVDMGYEPRSGEKHTMSILRDHILWLAALFGSDKTSEFAIRKFHSLMRGDDRIHPDILKSVMQVGALKANREAFEWLDKRLQTAESEHERMNILVALGCFRKPSMIKTVQQYVLAKVPARNQFVPIGCLATNPHAIPHMWEWYLSHLGELEQFHPMHYERVIAAIIPFCGMGREEEVTSFCDEHMKRKEKSRDVIKLSLERLEINSRMRAAHL